MDEHVEAALMEAGARINALVANERRLIDELSTLRKDAERYRWLRDAPRADVRIVGRGARKGDALDATVDELRGAG